MEMIIAVFIFCIFVLAGYGAFLDHRRKIIISRIEAEARLNENENGLEDINMRTEKYEKQSERIDNLEGSKKDILFIIDMINERINNLEKNTLSRKPPFPPPPDSFFRKPSESSPRK